MSQYESDVNQCDECGASFDTERGVFSHRRRKHPDEWLCDPVPFGMTEGYEQWYGEYKGEQELVGVSQLLAIAEGADPHRVFADDTVVHHGDDGNPRIPMCEARWANWSGNIEVMTDSEHTSHHNSPISESDLLDEIRRLDGELDRTPGFRNMNEHGEFAARTYVNHFGSWNEAVRAAGLEPRKPGGMENPPNKIPRADLLAEIRRLADELGKSPSVADLRELGEYPYTTYYNRFGGWVNAREQALDNGDTHEKGVLADIS